MSDAIQLVFNGLSTASFYALVALGVTLIFGLTGIVNFAHGQILMLGAYATWALAAAGVTFVAALAGAMIAMGALGFVLERGLFRFTLREPITGFIVSLGLIPVFEVIAVKLWGTDARSVFPPWTGSWDLGGAFLPLQRVVVLIITAIVIAVLFVWLTHTHTGRALRASAEDREMASLLGVRVRRVIVVTFVVGTGLAGLAGGLVASTLPVTPYIGGSYVFFGFAVALIGGLGNAPGAVLAAVTLGIAQQIFERYISPSASDAYVLALMIAILLVRPNGILRGSEGSRVA